jgi:hypothetical protein
MVMMRGEIGVHIQKAASAALVQAATFQAWIRDPFGIPVSCESQVVNSGPLSSSTKRRRPSGMCSRLVRSP